MWTGIVKELYILVSWRYVWLPWDLRVKLENRLPQHSGRVPSVKYTETSPTGVRHRRYLPLTIEKDSIFKNEQKKGPSKRLYYIRSLKIKKETWHFKSMPKTLFEYNEEITNYLRFYQVQYSSTSNLIVQKRI